MSWHRRSTRTKPLRKRWERSSSGRLSSQFRRLRSRCSTERWDRRCWKARTRIPANWSNLAIATTTPGSRTPSEAKPPDPRLTRWEIVGAWLHVWTPPKGLEVPPVPLRKLALWGLIGAIVIAAAAAIAVPKIAAARRKGAAELARDQAAADAK